MGVWDQGLRLGFGLVDEEGLGFGLGLGLGMESVLGLEVGSGSGLQLELGLGLQNIERKHMCSLMEGEGWLGAWGLGWRLGWSWELGLLFGVYCGCKS